MIFEFLIYITLLELHYISRSLLPDITEFKYIIGQLLLNIMSLCYINRILLCYQNSIMLDYQIHNFFHLAAIFLLHINNHLCILYRRCIFLFLIYANDTEIVHTHVLLHIVYALRIHAYS